MPEELPSLHVDTDWKKQAQEEKKRLAEEQQKHEARPAPGAPPPPALAPMPPAAGPPAPAGRGKEIPSASFTVLVQSLLTQALFYLGDLHTQAGEASVNLDMARRQLDLLTVLEEKTANNLTPDEQRGLDIALYESRTRFMSVASQYI